MIQDENLEVQPSEAEAAAVEPAAADPEAPQAVTNPRLVLKRSGEETDVVFLFGANAIVGRFDPTVGPIDIDLGGIPEGSYVSRKHAKITSADGVYTVTDLGSSNGTYIYKSEAGDFERVESSELADGDELAFGNARFVFRLA